jgi:hypothetical protein
MRSTRIRAVKCKDGRLMRHDPQNDDPYLETDIGKCPECNGHGCLDPLIDIILDIVRPPKFPS